MKITAVEVLPCEQRMGDPSWKFARAAVPRLEGRLLILRDDQGHEGLGYAHAIPSITTHGGGAHASLEWLRPHLLGRDPRDIGPLMDDIDARLASSASVKAAVDMALHDLVARALGVPVHVLLGGAYRRSVALSRVLAIKPPREMAARAAELTAQGYRHLKIKLSGDTALDVQRIAAVRDAAGADTALTLDPNQSYSAKQMMAAFARMERYDIALLEQPVPAADWEGLALLTRSLPVQVEADESAQTVQDVLRLVHGRMVDGINLKITKLGGVRRFLEAVRICEAGNVLCRVGAAFGPALLQAMALQAACAVRALPLACELAEHEHLLDDPFTSLPVVNGQLELPAGPGCGVALLRPAASASS